MKVATCSAGDSLIGKPPFRRSPGDRLRLAVSQAGLLELLIP